MWTVPLLSPVLLYFLFDSSDDYAYCDEKIILLMVLKTAFILSNHQPYVYHNIYH